MAVVHKAEDISLGRFVALNQDCSDCFDWIYNPRVRRERFVFAERRTRAKSELGLDGRESS
jgi:hypothetical protein